MHQQKFSHDGQKEPCRSNSRTVKQTWMVLNPPTASLFERRLRARTACYAGRAAPRMQRTNARDCFQWKQEAKLRLVRHPDSFLTSAFHVVSLLSKELFFQAKINALIIPIILSSIRPFVHPSIHPFVHLLIQAAVGIMLT